MRMPSSLKLVAATWIAALLGALAGGMLAEASGRSEEVPFSGASAPATQRAPNESPR